MSTIDNRETLAETGAEAGPIAGPATAPETAPETARETAPETPRDPWARLRRATPARIGLGRAGAGLPTGALLDFQHAHARARDAVHAPLDLDALAAALAPAPVIRVASAAPDRATYLRRPDLGRTLGPGDWPELAGHAAPDLVFVVADGLSAAAVAAHAAPLIAAARAALPELDLGPVVLVAQGRVAIGDEIGARLGAGLVAMLVGERPGLTVADSLGLYLTHDPRPGRRDSERNCLSNIHANGGLGYAQAAAKLAWLVREARARGLTGVGLKDDLPMTAAIGDAREAAEGNAAPALEKHTGQQG